MGTNAPPNPPSPLIEEYKTLRDETLKRIDARNQILSYTLVFAASMFSLALGKEGFRAVLLVYPLVSFFLAVSFAYNSLLLIEIGVYIRAAEKKIVGAGWATYLKPRYKFIEPFEVIATSGLFVVTQIVAIVLYRADGFPITQLHWTLWYVAIVATILTIVSIIYAVIYHRFALRRS